MRLVDADMEDGWLWGRCK